MRTLPLLLLPLALPTNMDMLFVQYAVLFYGYGVYLHWGFESTLISAHQSIVNGAYEHWCALVARVGARGGKRRRSLNGRALPPTPHAVHHARSASGEKQTFYTGFFFKCWDNLAGTVNRDACVCSFCEVKAGRRSREAWDALKKPDYSVLLEPSFWMGKKAE